MYQEASPRCMRLLLSILQGQAPVVTRPAGPAGRLLRRLCATAGCHLLSHACVLRRARHAAATRMPHGSGRGGPYPARATRPALLCRPPPNRRRGAGAGAAGERRAASSLTAPALPTDRRARGPRVQARGGRAGRGRRRRAAGWALVTLLLACAPAAAHSAAENVTQGDADSFRLETTDDGNDTLPFLHPRLVVFGDSISSTGRTSAVVQKALGLSRLVRPGREARSACHGLLARPRDTPSSRATQRPASAPFAC
jgi:hypothetical protein